jgi:hypothetical protein
MTTETAQNREKQPPSFHKTTTLENMRGELDKTQAALRTARKTITIKNREIEAKDQIISIQSQSMRDKDQIITLISQKR